MPCVYVASPLGFSVATRGFYDGVLLPEIVGCGWTPLDPWEDLDGSIGATFQEAQWLSAEARVAALRQLNRRLAEANEERIHAADAVLAVLDGADVDSGTAAEVGFAAALGKPTIGVRLDTRSTGDNEAAVVNLQLEFFITSRGGSVHRTVEDAVEALAALT